MDLRAYYKKVRETEAALSGENIVLVSLATSEGGKAGVLTEAPRAIAARMIAEGRARVAGDDEAAAFRQEMGAARERFEQQEAARRMQVVVIPAGEVDRTARNAAGFKGSVKADIKADVNAKERS